MKNIILSPPFCGLPVAKTAIALTALAALSTGVSALSFNLTFTPTSTAQDIAGFQAAADFWSSQFTDSVAINLNVGTAALGAGILAQAGSERATFSYTNFRNMLSADATSVSDNAALSSLAVTSSFGMLLNRTSNNPNGSGSATAYLDNDADANNTNIRITTANAKALGLSFTPPASDASITFGNAFSWDYDRSNGITSGTYDFVGIAIHEIGHSLGFISGVDVLDANSSSTFFADNQFTYVSSLDLFRYSTASTAQGVIDWTAGTTDKYFSLDNGVTSIARFSTGSTHGDGRQASHWKDSLGIGAMDPTAGTGELITVTANDLLAFDVIGWNLVPEPSAFLLSSFGLLFAMSRRCR
jgi:hypothetical protein